VDAVLIGSPDSVATLSFQLGVERIEEPYLFGGENGIVTLEQFSVGLLSCTVCPLVQLGARL
jgi:hypothetical protein